MLRVSSQGDHVDLQAITKGASGDVAGVACGAELIAYADAVVARSPDVTRTRDAVQKALGDEGVVDAAAIIANFQRMVRIADGVGIPVDSQLGLISADLRHEIGIDEFSSAQGRGKNGALRRLAAPLMRSVMTRLIRMRSR